MCQKCGWAKFAAEIQDALDGGECSFAEETLSGILKTVTEKEHATENQARAVNNIVVASMRPRSGGSSGHRTYGRR